MKTTTQILESALAAGTTKAALPWRRTLALALLAGAFIALGGLLSIIASRSACRQAPAQRRRISHRTNSYRYARRRVIHGQQRRIDTGTGGKTHIPDKRPVQLDACLAGQLCRGFGFCRNLCTRSRDSRCRPVARCYHRHSRSQSLDAMAHHILSRHRSQLVRMPGRMDGFRSRGPNRKMSGLLDTGGSFRGTGMGTQHCQYVLHPGRHSHRRRGLRHTNGM